MWRNLEIQDGRPRWQTFRNHGDCCSFAILGVKEGFKGRGWGGGVASGAPAQSQSVKKKPGLDRANLPFMFYSHCHLISRTLKEKLRPTKDL